MTQREVTIDCAVAWLFWGLGMVFAGASLVFPHVHIMGPTVLCVGAAAVLHVRTMLAGCEDRQRRALEVWRQSAEERVRSVK